MAEQAAEQRGRAGAGERDAAVEDAQAQLKAQGIGQELEGDSGSAHQQAGGNVLGTEVQYQIRQVNAVQDEPKQAACRKQLERC